MRVYVKSRSRNGLDKKVTVRVVDVKSIPPHMGFAHKRWSKSDAPLTTGVVGDPIIRINVSADDRRRLRENNVLSQNEFGQVR